MGSGEFWDWKARHVFGGRALMASASAFAIASMLAASPVEARLPDPADAAQSALGQAAALPVIQVAEKKITYSINIPEGPLGPALVALAEQTGLKVSTNAASVAGRTTSGVSGEMTAQAALSALLKNSGLEPTEVSGAGFVVAPPPGAYAQAADVPLPGIYIEAGGASSTTPTESGVSDQTGEPTAYSPVEGYVAQRTASGSKTDTPLKEIPQGITVVGQEQIRDQGAKTLQQTLHYVPSVTSDLFGEDTRNDGFAIRGQEATVQFLDGLRRFYGNYLNAPRVEPYTLERIEVLRGPSSVLYGQSGVGGTINMVSKRPAAEKKGEVGVSYGNYNDKEAFFDFTGPVTADGKWLYRIVGLGRDSDTQVDFVEDQRFVFAPSLTWRPSADTSVTLLTEVRRDRGGPTSQFLPHEGTLFAGPNGFVPINRFVGEPDFDRYDADSWSVALIADHKFNSVWSFHQGLRYSSNDVTYGQIFPYIPDRTEPFFDEDRRLIARDMFFADAHTDTITSDSNVVARFETGRLQHKVLAGFDYSRGSESSRRRGFATDCGLFDLFAPTYGEFEVCDFDLNPIGTLPIERFPDREQWQSGIYAQDQLRLGPLIAVVGLRRDWTATETDGAPDETAAATTRRAGLMYELPFGLTPYMNYAESFVPLSGSDFFDRPFEPLEGQSMEVGFKYQRPGSSFTVTSAVFDATEVNRLAEDPLHLGFSVQSAEVSLKGFEIEARGAVTDNIKIIAAYSYLSAKHTAGDQAGFRVESLPEHLASLWAIYTFHEGMLNGFSIGGGVRYNGPSWDGYDLVETPSFTLFDAMVAYETEHWRWSLNATNLEDEYHLTTCLNRGDCFIGAGREITTSLIYKF